MLRMYEPGMMLLGNSVNQELHVIVRFIRNTDFKIFLVTLTRIKRDSHSKDHSKSKKSSILINIITKANLILVIF
jgi:type IV secretory pathway VirB3-like protein